MTTYDVRNYINNPKLTLEISTELAVLEIIFRIIVCCYEVGFRNCFNLIKCLFYLDILASRRNISNSREVSYGLESILCNTPNCRSRSSPYSKGPPMHPFGMEKRDF